MKKTVIVPDNEWESSIYNTIEWQRSVEIDRYEHDYEKQIRTVIWIEK